MIIFEFNNLIELCEDMHDVNSCDNKILKSWYIFITNIESKTCKLGYMKTKIIKICCMIHLLIFNLDWKLSLVLTYNLYKTFFLISVVKEEIVDDDAHLPCFNGRVVSWVRFKNIFSNTKYI